MSQVAKCRWELRGHSEAISSVEYSSTDVNRLASGSLEGEVIDWEVEGCSRVAGKLSDHKQVYSLSHTPDGTRLVVGCDYGQVLLRSPGPAKRLTGPNGTVLSVKCSPDGRHFASGGYYDGKIFIWDLATERVVMEIKTGDYVTVWSLSYSPDGTHLYAGGIGNVKVYDVSSGRELSLLSGHLYQVLSVSCAPDGKRLVSGSWDETMIVWDLVNGSELKKITCDDRVLSVQYSPDGSNLACAGARDHSVSVFDSGSYELLLKLNGHTDTVWSLSYSRDGRRLASGSWDGSVRIWDVATAIATVRTRDEATKKKRDNLREKQLKAESDYTQTRRDTAKERNLQRRSLEQRMSDLKAERLDIDR